MFALEMNQHAMSAAAWIVGCGVGNNLGKDVTVLYDSTPNLLGIFCSIVYFNSTLM
jgi:hypothetical protein